MHAIRSLPFLLISLALGGVASGSEQSALLVAKGEVAYHQGRYEEARARFAEALVSDPADAEAEQGLGLALERLGRVEDARQAHARARALLSEGAEPAVGVPGPEGRPWSVYALTGVGYDSNVSIAPSGDRLGGRQPDAVFTFEVGGRYDLVQSPTTLLRLEYDFGQTLHPHVNDFNLRDQRVRGTVSHAVLPQLWLGVQGGYEHSTLGEDSYLGEVAVMPFLSLLEGERGMTQVTYRHGGDTYFSQPFDDVRDGPSDAGGVSQTVYFAEGRYATAGFQYGSERPTSSAGDDYRLRFYQPYVGAGFRAWWRTTVDLMYLYRYDNYTEPNSFSDFRTRRHDSVHYFYAAVERPIVPHVSALIAYLGTLDESNISLFAYNRQTVSMFVRVTY
jgi:hypothetical protein